MTSMQSLGESFSWDGSTEAKSVKWAPGQPASGECASLTKVGMTIVSCDSANNFMCESKSGSSSTNEPGATNQDSFVLYAHLG
jgi:hypothetical protein